MSLATLPVVERDVTESSEPKFFRALINARYGNLSLAKTDSDIILRSDPNDQSYQALSAYIAALSGDRRSLDGLSKKPITDARAASLAGEAAYLIGEAEIARDFWTQEAKLGGSTAILTCLAGKKHRKYGQERIALSLLAECVAVTPDSKEGKGAQELLAASAVPKMNR